MIRGLISGTTSTAFASTRPLPVLTTSWRWASYPASPAAGVISGKPGNLFDPKGNATRAEAATILRRFVELVIDEGTARGWVQNDAG